MGEPFGDCATQHKAGGRIYGGGSSGGGGGASPPATQTQIVDLPDWAKPYAKESLGKAAALTDTSQNPYQAYGGDRQAGFTDLQTQAFTGAEGMAPSSAMGTAAGMAGTAGIGALQAGAAFNPYQTGQFTGQTAQDYMNPYMQNVVDIQKREAQRQADVAGTQRAGQAVKAGAFGGSRQAIMEAEANRNLGQQMGDIQARGQQAAYQDAASRFAQEQQLREQSRQYGAGLGMQGFQTALTGAGQLANIGQQTFGQEMDINKLQQQYGTQQQAFAQQGLDTEYQDFLNQQRYPYQQLEFMNSMLRGTPMGTVSSMYAPPPSTTSQMIGLGTTAVGLGRMAGMKEGGEVQGYAVGGGITGLLKDEQLQQRTQMPTVSMLAKMAAQDELQARAQMRAGAAAQQAPQGDQPSVADEYMASRGVASLPTGEINMAGGGILAFAAGDSVPGATNVNKAFTTFLESIGKTSKDFIDGSPAEKKALRAAFDKATSGPSPAPTAAPTAGRATPKVAPKPGILGRLSRGAKSPLTLGALGLYEASRYIDGDAVLSGLGAAADAVGNFATSERFMSPEDRAAMEPQATEEAAIQPPTGAGAGRGSYPGYDAEADARARGQAQQVVPDADIDAPPMSGTPAGPAAQSGMTLEQVQAMTQGDPNARQAYIDQIDLANVAREDVYKQGIANLQRDQEAMGEYGTEREAKLKKQEEGLAGLEKRNKSMALIEAGLAIMSGNSANAFENIGKGALIGTKAYREGMDKIEAKRTKLDDALMNLYDIRRGEKVASKKELRAAETAYEAAKAESARAMADVTGKLYDAKRAESLAAVEAWAKMREGELDRASNEYRTRLTTDATLNAAMISAAKAQGLTEKDLIGMRQKAQTLVQQRIKDTAGLAQRIQKDPSIRERLMRDALAEVGVPGASGGQDSGNMGTKLPPGFKIDQ